MNRIPRTIEEFHERIQKLSDLSVPEPEYMIIDEIGYCGLCKDIKEYAISRGKNSIKCMGCDSWFKRRVFGRHMYVSVFGPFSFVPDRSVAVNVPNEAMDKWSYILSREGQLELLEKYLEGHMERVRAQIMHHSRAAVRLQDDLKKLIRLERSLPGS